MLFYMVLAFYQINASKLKENPQIPDIYKFIEFYCRLDETKYKIQIDLSEIFPGKSEEKTLTLVDC